LDESIEKVRTLVQNDHCVAVGMIAEEVNLNRETAVDFDGKFGLEGSLCKGGAQGLISCTQNKYQ
jgi:hypothetical protein